MDRRGTESRLTVQALENAVTRRQVNKSFQRGCVPRIAGKLRHIGVGRTHAATHVLLLVHDLDVQIINAATGEILRELTIDLTRDYQPRHQAPDMTMA